MKMSERANKWGPALATPVEASSATVRPTDIAAAIAAGLSIRLGNQASSYVVPVQQNVASEFEIND